MRQHEKRENTLHAPRVSLTYIQILYVSAEVAWNFIDPNAETEKLNGRVHVGVPRAYLNRLLTTKMFALSAEVALEGCIIVLTFLSSATKMPLKTLNCWLGLGCSWINLYKLSQVAETSLEILSLLSLPKNVLLFHSYVERVRSLIAGASEVKRLRSPREKIFSCDLVSPF